MKLIPTLFFIFAVFYSVESKVYIGKQSVLNARSNSTHTNVYSYVVDTIKGFGDFILKKEITNINEKKVYAIKMTPRKGDTDTFYFDAVTGLVAGVSSTAEMQGQEVKTSVLFRDYKAVDGVQIPHTLKLEEPASAGFTIRLESVKHNLKPDSKWFRKTK